MTDSDLRQRLLDLSGWMATRIREGNTTHTTQDLHNVVSAYFILRPYDSGSALLASSHAGFSNRPDDVAEPGLLVKP